MARARVLAAGGIVVRGGDDPLIAVVRLRKNKTWVLPKGKLKPNEDALAAARREVLEETGHDVSVHEFLGAMSHETDGKVKVVQFWHMRTIGGPVRELMRDVKAVQWLPLHEAVEKLTHTREQVFLSRVGPIAINGDERRKDLAVEATTASDAVQLDEKPTHATLAERTRTWLRRMVTRGAPQA